MFSPYLVDWENINFEVCLAVVKNLHSGNAMKVWKTWLNGWHTSSRCQATQFHPCLFGCHGARDDLHHYIICPQLCSLRKYLYRDLSQYPLDRFGLYGPGHELMVHLCCAYGATLKLVQSGMFLLSMNRNRPIIPGCDFIMETKKPRDCRNSFMNSIYCANLLLIFLII